MYTPSSQLFVFLFHRFTTGDKLAGGRGFRAVWTEVKATGDCDEANHHFRCVNNSFCIAKHLECDGNLNCGVNDDSDEAHCNSFDPSIPANIDPMHHANLLLIQLGGPAGESYFNL